MTSSRSDDAEDKAELFIPSIGFQCSLTDLPEPRGSFPYMFGGNVEPAAAGWGTIVTADIMPWNDLCNKGMVQGWCDEGGEERPWCVCYRS